MNLKKLFAISVLTLTLSTSLLTTQTMAYPQETTMDFDMGFGTGYSKNIKTRYWKYGNADWSSYVQYAKQQLSNSKANISINVSNNHGYNDTAIRISSSYMDGDFAGVTDKANDVDGYTVDLNSSAIERFGLSTFQLQAITLHEICHTFGLNDCSGSNYLMCGFFTSVKVNKLQPLETNLLIDRYGQK